MARAMDLSTGLIQPNVKLYSQSLFSVILMREGFEESFCNFDFPAADIWLFVSSAYSTGFIQFNCKAFECITCRSINVSICK